MQKYNINMFYALLIILITFILQYHEGDYKILEILFGLCSKKG